MSTTETEQLTAVARERADKRIDAALGALHAAAHEIGIKHGIPEGIAGHSIEELLGRMAYIPTMARDLRRACGQEIAKEELNKVFEQSDALQQSVADHQGPKMDKRPTPPIEPSKIPINIPVGMDVGDLDGISTQTINALRTAGLTTVGEIVNIPDEHLVKLNGLGEKSIAHIRVAIAKASEGKPG